MEVIFLVLMAERKKHVMIVVDQAYVSTISEKILVLFAILPLRRSASVVSSKMIVLFAIRPLRNSASVVMVSEKQIVSLAHLIYSVHITDHEISARPAGREQKTNYDYHIYLYLKLAALDC